MAESWRTPLHSSRSIIFDWVEIFLPGFNRAQKRMHSFLDSAVQPIKKTLQKWSLKVMNSWTRVFIAGAVSDQRMACN